MSTLLETELLLDEIPFTVEYYYEPGEQTTHWYHSSPASVEMKRILFADEELSAKQEEFFIDKYGETAFNDFMREDAHEQKKDIRMEGR